MSNSLFALPSPSLVLIMVVNIHIIIHNWAPNRSICDTSFKYQWFFFNFKIVLSYTYTVENKKEKEIRKKGEREGKKERKEGSSLNSNTTTDILV